jgi:hypothetical protein
MKKSGVSSSICIWCSFGGAQRRRYSGVSRCGTVRPGCSWGAAAAAKGTCTHWPCQQHQAAASLTTPPADAHTNTGTHQVGQQHDGLVLAQQHERQARARRRIHQARDAPDIHRLPHALHHERGAVDGAALQRLEAAVLHLQPLVLKPQQHVARRHVLGQLRRLRGAHDTTQQAAAACARRRRRPAAAAEQAPDADAARHGHALLLRRAANQRQRALPLGLLLNRCCALRCRRRRRLRVGGLLAGRRCCCRERRDLLQRELQRLACGRCRALRSDGLLVSGVGLLHHLGRLLAADNARDALQLQRHTGRRLGCGSGRRTDTRWLQLALLVCLRMMLRGCLRGCTLTSANAGRAGGASGVLCCCLDICGGAAARLPCGSCGGRGSIWHAWGSVCHAWCVGADDCWQRHEALAAQEAQQASQQLLLRSAVLLVRCACWCCACCLGAVDGGSGRCQRQRRCSQWVSAVCWRQRERSSQVAHQGQRVRAHRRCRAAVQLLHLALRQQLQLTAGGRGQQQQRQLQQHMLAQRSQCEAGVRARCWCRHVLLVCCCRGGIRDARRQCGVHDVRCRRGSAVPRLRCRLQQCCGGCRRGVADSAWRGGCRRQRGDDVHAEHRGMHACKACGADARRQQLQQVHAAAAWPAGPPRPQRVVNNQVLMRAVTGAAALVGVLL